jgi:hypothetical protein
MIEQNGFPFFSLFLFKQTRPKCPLDKKQPILIMQLLPKYAMLADRKTTHCHIVERRTLMGWKIYCPIYESGQSFLPCHLNLDKP